MGNWLWKSQFGVGKEVKHFIPDAETDPTNEIWGVDNNYGPTSQGVISPHLDMTYRYAGDKMVVWMEDYPYSTFKLNSNCGGIAILNNNSPQAPGIPRVTTNSINHRDLFITWTDGYDLDGDSSVDQALYVQELYP